MLGPIAVEASLDDDLGPVVAGAPRDLHLLAHNLRRWASRSGGTVIWRRRAASRLTITRLVVSGLYGSDAGLAPRTIFDASTPESVPLRGNRVRA